MILCYVQVLRTTALLLLLYDIILVQSSLYYYCGTPLHCFAGKNDMPLVFRLVGRGVGKVSGLVQGGQARVGELSKGSELLQVISP